MVPDRAERIGDQHLLTRGSVNLPSAGDVRLTNAPAGRNGASSGDRRRRRGLRRVTTARAVRVFKTCGTDAVEVITKNPCRLTRDIRGIGFRIADAIAMKLGITSTAMTRVRAGIGYAPTEAMDDGHCGLPADELGPLAARLLDVPDDAVRTALELAACRSVSAPGCEPAEDAVVADTVADTPCVFLGGLYQAERAIAERLVDLVAGKRPGRTSTSSGRCPGSRSRAGQSLAPG